MARPKKEISQKQFESLCGIQCTKEEICSVLDVTDKTLENWCKRTYKKGFSEIFKLKRGNGKASLRRSQWIAAEKGNPTMLVWLGKQYLGQREPLDEKKLEIELLKLESKIKDSQPKEEAEDNFMDTLNGTAAEVWEESEVEEE